MIMGSASLEAQPGKDPNYKYPKLSDKDFKLFFKFVDNVTADKDPMEFLKANKVTDEYLQAVMLKITINTMGIAADSMDEVKERYGQSIVFNRSESALYKKYEQRIMEAFVKLND
jgi:hypothetical protein